MMAGGSPRKTCSGRRSPWPSTMRPGPQPLQQRRPAPARPGSVEGAEHGRPGILRQAAVAVMQDLVVQRQFPGRSGRDRPSSATDSGHRRDVEGGERFGGAGHLRRGRRPGGQRPVEQAPPGRQPAHPDQPVHHLPPAPPIRRSAPSGRRTSGSTSEIDLRRQPPVQPQFLGAEMPAPFQACGSRGSGHRTGFFSL